MKLMTHIENLGINITEAARQMKKPQQRVHLWATDQRIPRKSEMRDIYVWSNGVVEPNDFYDLPDLDQIRANGHDHHLVDSQAAA